MVFIKRYNIIWSKYEMLANEKCLKCLLEKNMANAQKFDIKKREEFAEKINALLSEYGDKKSAPYLQSKIDGLYERIFLQKCDFAQIKEKYNRFMLGKEPIIKRHIFDSDDIIGACIKFVCAGNYIDFAAVDRVDDSVLNALFEKAQSEEIDSERLKKFKTELENANSLVYLTDNCGEIVVDKIFIEAIQKLYPQIEVTVIVRGGDALNDATIIDAQEVGLDRIVKTIGNGTDIPGTVMDEISEEALQAIKNADIIISKGQGNFETMFGEGFNTYFMFLCKCEMFVERFGLKQFASVFANEKDITIKK